MGFGRVNRKTNDERSIKHADYDQQRTRDFVDDAIVGLDADGDGQVSKREHMNFRKKMKGSLTTGFEFFSNGLNGLKMKAPTAGLAISYEDAEGLLVNAGVVAALMLSLSVATTFMHWPGDTDKAVLFSNMRFDFDFRNNFLKAWLNDNNVDFDRPTVKDKNGNDMFDIGTLMNTEPTADEMSDPNFMRNLEVFFFMIIGLCEDDDQRSKLYNEGLGWIRLNNPTNQPDGLTPKFDYFKYGNVATVLFFSSLMMSLLFYTTLAISSAGETDIGLKHWMRFGGIAIIMCYILMGVGMGYFFGSLLALSRVQYAWAVYGDWFEEDCLYFLLIPLMAVSIIMALILFMGAAMEAIGLGHLGGWDLVRCMFFMKTTPPPIAAEGGDASAVEGHANDNDVQNTHSPDPLGPSRRVAKTYLSAESPTMDAEDL
jgi:hypothetical protein